LPAFGRWEIIPRRNPAELKLLALVASVRVVLDKRACQGALLRFKEILLRLKYGRSVLSGKRTMKQYV